MKTREEVEELKANWRCDPCWDIELTEGFEEYREELREFSKAEDEKWAAAALKRNQELSEKYGIPGNFRLLHQLTYMQEKIDELEEKIFNIQNKRPC